MINALNITTHIVSAGCLGGVRNSVANRLASLNYVISSDFCVGCQYYLILAATLMYSIYIAVLEIHRLELERKA